MYVLNIYIVITLGELSCIYMELLYSCTDYPYGFPMLIYIIYLLILFYFLFFKYTIEL